MNFLDLTNNGGHPFTGNDAMYLQNEIRKVFYHLFKSMGDADPIDFTVWINKPVINTFSTIAGDFYEHGEGLVVIGGEARVVPSCIGSPKPYTPFGGHDFYAITVDVNDPIGVVNTQSGNTVATWKNRIAEIIYGPVPSQSFNDNPDFTYIFYNLLNSAGLIVTPAALTAGLNLKANKIIDIWHIVGNPSEPVYGTGWSFYSAAMQFRKNDVGQVSIKLSAQNGAYVYGTPNHVVFTLPVGYRPSFSQIIKYGSNGDQNIVINPSGTVSYTNSTIGTPGLAIIEHFITFDIN
jgi:hypothetical protein